MTDDYHPNFTRDRSRDLPPEGACAFCKIPSPIIVHAFREEGHCEKRECVEKCESCQAWFEAIGPEKEPRNAERKKEPDPEAEREAAIVWPAYYFTEAEEDECRKRRASLDKILFGNHSNKKVGTRWVGQAGEMGLRMFWEGKGFVEGRDFHDMTRTGRLDYDFRIGRIPVDSKTLARTVPPKSHYGATVFCTQHSARKCDAYIFGSYNVRDHIGHIVGWMTYEEFDQRKYLRKKGDRVTSSFGAETDTWEVRIEWLSPIDSFPIVRA